MQLRSKGSCRLRSSRPRCCIRLASTARAAAWKAVPAGGPLIEVTCCAADEPAPPSLCSSARTAPEPRSPKSEGAATHAGHGSCYESRYPITNQPGEVPAMTTKLLLAGALIALLILPAGAQQAPQGTPTRIRGTVEKLDGQALTVKSREGETVTIALADNVAVAYLVKKNVGDIKPGDYIASTGIT